MSGERYREDDLSNQASNWKIKTYVHAQDYYRTLPYSFCTPNFRNKSLAPSRTLRMYIFALPASTPQGFSPVQYQ